MKINGAIEIDDNELRKIFAEIRSEKKSEFSDYARVFDEGCPGWCEDPEYVLCYLKHQEHYANEQLRMRGHLFLNEVYDMLGIPRSKAGQIVGWIYDEQNPIGDNFVSFGIYTFYGNKDFINGYKNTVLLDFNVDGEILSKI